MRPVTYHPIGDPHHCIYRMVCVLGSQPQKTYFIDKFKIMDFFVLFPNMLMKISRSRSLISSMANLDKSLFENPYQIMPDKKSLFNQLSEIHRASISHLLAKGILKLDSFNSGRITLSENSEIQLLVQEFYNNTSIDKNLLSLIATDLGDMELLGQNGIKARTGLLEYRYDT